MAIITAQDSLADTLLRHPQLIPVVARLGVRPGVGSASIGATCLSAGRDVSFFLAIVNTFVHRDYFPSVSGSCFDAEQTVEYLRKTDIYYRDVQFANIERHFVPLMRTARPGNNVRLLMDFFDGIKCQAMEFVNRDLEVLESYASTGGQSDMRSKIESSLHEQNGIEEKLRDLMRLFVVQLKGVDDVNLCAAVVSSLHALAQDMQQNNRIRSRILMPSVCGDASR